MSGGKWETGIESIGRLPSGWHLQRLSNVADLFGRIGWQGLTSDEYTDEGAYLVTSTDFVDGCVNWDTCVHVSEERWEEAWQIKLSEGDLLISKDGTIGKLAIVKDMPGHASLNSGLMRIVPKSDAYETRFLFYVLQTDVFTDWYRSIDSGASTIKHLFQGDFVHFVFPLPPVEEQRRIVRDIDSRVSKLDCAMALIERQISTLEAYRRSFIQETVTKGLDPTAPMTESGIDWIGLVPAHWTIRKTKHLAAISSGSTPDRSDLSYWDGTIPWVRTGELQNNMIDDTELKITERALRNCSLRLYEPGTLLIAMYGQGKTRGMTAMLGIRSATNQACAALTANTNLITSEYLWAAFQAAYDAIREMAQGSGQPNLSAEIISRFSIPVPPIDEQKEICDRFFSRLPVIDKTLQVKRGQLSVLREQRQSLIYEYVTGKRRVAEVRNG